MYELYHNTRKKYWQSPKGKLVCKLASQKYYKTKKGKLKQKQNNILHQPIKNLRKDKYLIIENCAICNSSKNIEIHHPNPDYSDLDFQKFHIYFLCNYHHLKEHTNY